MVEVSLGYRASAWWLGSFEQSASECGSLHPCALSIPYSNQLHRPALELELSTTSDFALEAEAALEHRIYWDEGLYRLTSGVEVSEERRDTALYFALQARVPVDKKLHLVLGVDYTRNRSTIDEATVEIDEGYDRFTASASLRYRK
jgi:hypothetical protein